MAPLTWSEKLFFAIVALSALWVGSWSYFVPTDVQYGIPWNVPPLHARFVGSIYLSAALFCFGSIFARTYDEVRAILPMIAIWTLVVFLVSFLYLTEADYHRFPIWIWIIAYLVYPLIAIWLVWVHRRDWSKAAGSTLPAWARTYLLVQGIVLVVAAAALLLLPDFMIKIWPWALTRQLAQIYSGPILCYGVGSLLISRGRSFAEIRIALAGMLVFSVAVLVASVINRAVFAGVSPAVVLWFAGFAVAAAILGNMLARAWWAPQAA